MENLRNKFYSKNLTKLKYFENSTKHNVNLKIAWKADQKLNESKKIISQKSRISPNPRQNLQPKSKIPETGRRSLSDKASQNHCLYIKTENEFQKKKISLLYVLLRFFYVCIHLATYKSKKIFSKRRKSHLVLFFEFSLLFFFKKYFLFYYSFCQSIRYHSINIKWKFMRVCRL